MPQNPNCDGAHCTCTAGETRRLPTGGTSAVILCRSCYRKEINWRIEKNRRLTSGNQFPLPEWYDLEAYP